QRHPDRTRRTVDEGHVRGCQRVLHDRLTLIAGGRAEHDVDAVVLNELAHRVLRGTGRAVSAFVDEPHGLATDLVAVLLEHRVNGTFGLPHRERQVARVDGQHADDDLAAAVRVPAVVPLIATTLTGGQAQRDRSSSREDCDRLRSGSEHHCFVPFVIVEAADTSASPGAVSAADCPARRARRRRRSTLICLDTPASPAGAKSRMAMKISPVSVMYRSVMSCAKLSSRLNSSAPMKAPPSEPMQPVNAPTRSSSVALRLTVSGSACARSNTMMTPPRDAIRETNVTAPTR